MPAAQPAIKRFGAYLKRLNNTESLSEEMLIDLVLTTDPDTRQRKRSVLAANSLAKFAKLNVDFNRYKGKYSHLNNSDRELPTDEEIAKYYWSIPNGSGIKKFPGGIFMLSFRR